MNVLGLRFGGGDMATRYGQGLNREIVSAVRMGALAESLIIASVRAFAEQRWWDVPGNYLRCCLCDATSETHSHTYGKYFERVGKGEYRVRDEYRR